jgi:hypothetical protein
MASFSKGLGNWAGNSEVYDGKGQFLGHLTDSRNVQKISENQLRIDLSLTGVLSLEGHYTIETREGYRLYQGPANLGFAEALGEDMVDANNYWAHWGLSQRFFLYVTPEKTMQLSLALLSRGEDLQYVIIGENYLLDENTAEKPETKRGENLLHRAGCWQGEMTILDGSAKPIGKQSLCQTITNSLDLTVERSAFVKPYRLSLQVNENQAWTGAGDVVGSYSHMGGRALSGQFHHLEQELRVWWREVVTGDGSKKIVFQNFYRGGQRVGIQYGLMHYER